MTTKALGLIETIGLVSAVEAADAAAKAASVVVLGYENAKGGGRIAVKLAGDVGAVKAAVAAGSAAALRVGQVASCLVIPRPHEEIAALVAQITRGRVLSNEDADLDPEGANLNSEGANFESEGADLKLEGADLKLEGAD
ncbi:MAG TPA: BMC domain-containing protein, partial [Chloroflexaceae bacterium]|nr:BMC domain-containing protein [Chloroflexaceae bacterium]